MRVNSLSFFLNRPIAKWPKAVLIIGREKPVVTLYRDILVLLLEQAGAHSRTVEHVDELSQHIDTCEPDLFQNFIEVPERGVPEVVSVRHVTGNDLKALKDKLGSLDGPVLCGAAGLKAQTQLAKWFVLERDLVSLSAYAVDASLIRLGLVPLAQKYGLRFSNGQQGRIAAHYARFPDMFFSDLKKMSYLALDRSAGADGHYDTGAYSVRDEQLDDLMTVGVAKEIDAIIDAILMQQPKTFLYHSDLALLEHHDFLLIRALLNQVVVLLSLAAEMEHHGKSFQEATKQARVRVFFHKEGVLKRALSLWSYQDIASLLQRLVSLEKHYKAEQWAPAGLRTELFELIPQGQGAR